MTSKQIVGVVFLVLGLIAGYVAYHLAKAPAHLRQHGVTANAKIIRLIERRSARTRKSKNTRPSFYPVFAFTDENGKQHQIESEFGRNAGVYAPGDDLEVIYYPGEPESVQLNDTMSLYFFTICASFVGLLMMTCCVLQFVLPLQKNQQTS